MRKSDQLAKTIARLEERDEQFAPLETTATRDSRGHLVYPVSAVAEVMGFKDESDPKFQRAVDKAKITIRKSGKKIADHFIPGELFQRDTEVCVTVYAAFLIVLSGSSETSDLVARAHDYFASKANAQIVEDEKRLRNRFDVIEENKRLNSTAKVAGVQNFARFTAAGYQGLYGERNIDDVARHKGLAKGSDVLDYAGSEELAAHLFRITQTTAALKRDHVKTESLACHTHKRVGREVRMAISRMGGTMPEELPPAEKRIDTVITETGRRLEQKS